VESSVMKNLLCEQLWICEDIDKTSNYFWSNTLKVSLNSFSPNNQVAPTSWTISIWKFDFEAVWWEISINAINLRREWLWNSSDIRRIYFERNGTRVSNIAWVASDGYAYLTFSPALVINGGSSLSLDLMVEINGSNYGWEHKFSIPSADSIQAQDLKKISGSFPVVTWSLGIISYSLSEIDVYQIYWQANYSPTRYGISAWNFRISIPSWQNDYEFKSIKIRNAWDADSSLLWNIWIYKNGTEISSSISKNGREFTIKLYDLVKSWNSVNYEIRIDMVSCKWYNEYGYYEDDKYYKCEDLEKELYKFEIRNAYDIEITDYNNNLSPKVNLK
jgi:hypothetical protein